MFRPSRSSTIVQRFATCAVHPPNAAASNTLRSEVLAQRVLPRIARLNYHLCMPDAAPAHPFVSDHCASVVRRARKLSRFQQRLAKGMDIAVAEECGFAP